MALPGGILTIIVLMVVPIPAFMLDLFFVINIAFSVAILMAAMNAEKPLDFSSFPSVLLFATLLRLALNVASTRVVLLHGHEGEAAAGEARERALERRIDAPARGFEHRRRERGARGDEPLALGLAPGF